MAMHRIARAAKHIETLDKQARTTRTSTSGTAKVQAQLTQWIERERMASSSVQRLARALE